MFKVVLGVIGVLTGALLFAFGMLADGDPVGNISYIAGMAVLAISLFTIVRSAAPVHHDH